MSHGPQKKEDRDTSAVQENFWTSVCGTKPFSKFPNFQISRTFWTHRRCLKQTILASEFSKIFVLVGKFGRQQQLFKNFSSTTCSLFCLLSSVPSPFLLSRERWTDPKGRPLTLLLAQFSFPLSLLTAPVKGYGGKGQETNGSKREAQVALVRLLLLPNPRPDTQNECGWSDTQSPGKISGSLSARKPKFDEIRVSSDPLGRNFWKF